MTYVNRVTGALRRPAPKAAKGPNLYPLQLPLFVLGLGFAVLALGLSSWVMAIAVLVLFTLVGATWRADIPPVIPACIAFQWIFACSAYLWRIFGGEDFVPVEEADLRQGLLLSMLGLVTLVAGLRFALRLFHRQFMSISTLPPSHYVIKRLFWATIVAVAAYDVVFLAPQSIWLGAAQIIQTLLLLRFVPFFLLAVTVFERSKGYSYLAIGSAWVIAPEFLTGFSTFREILLVLVIAALSQWRPWIPTRAQKRRNLRIAVLGIVGMAVVASVGLVWTGGVKTEWRERLATSSRSPIAKLGTFADTVGDTVSHLDLKAATESYVGRLSSSAYYFALVHHRIPRDIAFENGKLLMMAISNATTPRFIFSDKPIYASDSWLVRKYTGLYLNNDDDGTSIALGYMVENYIDFGILGVVLITFAWGATGGISAVVMARASPSREIMIALLLGLFIQSYMTFETSFIKLPAGLIIRVVLTSLVFVMVGRPFHRWLSAAPRKAPATTPGAPRFVGRQKLALRPGESTVR